MIKFSQEEIDGIAESVRQGAIDELRKTIVTQLSYVTANELRDQIGPVVKELIAEMKPEIESAISAAKPVIIKAIVAQCESAASDITAALSKKIAETLASDYQRGQVIKTLLGGY